MFSLPTTKGSIIRRDVKRQALQIPPSQAGGDEQNKPRFRRIPESYGPIKMTFTLGPNGELLAPKATETSSRAASSSQASTSEKVRGMTSAHGRHSPSVSKYIAPAANNPDAQALGQGAWERQLKCSEKEAAAVRAVRDGTALDGRWPTSSDIQQVMPRGCSSTDEAAAPSTSSSMASYDNAAASGASSPCPDTGVVLHHASEGWFLQPHHLSTEDLWQRIRAEATKDAGAEAALASYLYSSILAHRSFDRAMAYILSNKLASATLLSTHLYKLFTEVYESDPAVFEDAVADLQAVFDRDPACERYTQCILYFKGYQAIQVHRIAHHLWRQGRRALALALQSRVAEVFHVDIHPAAKMGRGILVDHATGVVIGETAEVGDNVSILHHVTLGGSGTGKGVRHPKIGHGCLLGAGVCVLGPVRVGDGAKVGAGSVVVQDIPEHSVAVGVPARIVRQEKKLEPVESMDQTSDFIFDYVI